MATIRKRNGKWQAQVRIKGSGALSRTFLTKQMHKLGVGPLKQKPFDVDCRSG